MTNILQNPLLNDSKIENISSDNPVDDLVENIEKISRTTPTMMPEWMD